jgi:hypothetical protein
MTNNNTSILLLIIQPVSSFATSVLGLTSAMRVPTCARFKYEQLEGLGKLLLTHVRLLASHHGKLLPLEGFLWSTKRFEYLFVLIFVL